MEPFKPMKPMEPMAPPKPWWPESLGTSPESAGGQNDLRYAYFSHQHRLAIDDGHSVSVYDTGDHAVAGVLQRHDGGGKRILFTSQKGEVDLQTLGKITP